MLEKDEYGIPKFPKRPTSQGADRIKDVNTFKLQAEKVAAEMRAMAGEMLKNQRQSGEAA